MMSHLIESWHAPLGAAPTGAALDVIGHDDAVVLVRRGATTLALEARTGAQRWRRAPLAAHAATVGRQVAVVAQSRTLAAPVVVNARGDARLYELALLVLALGDGRTVHELALPEALQQLSRIALAGDGATATLWALGAADGARRALLARPLDDPGAAWRTYAVPATTADPVPCAGGLACMVAGQGVHRITDAGPRPPVALAVAALLPLASTGDLLALVAPPTAASGPELVRLDGTSLATTWRVALAPEPHRVPGQDQVATSAHAVAHPARGTGEVAVRDAGSGAIRCHVATGLATITRLAFAGADLVVCGHDARRQSVLVVIDAERGHVHLAARAPLPLAVVGPRLLFQLPGEATIVALVTEPGAAATWPASLAGSVGPWSRPVTTLLDDDADWSPPALHLFAAAVADRLLDGEDAARAPRRAVHTAQAAVAAQRGWAQGTATARQRRTRLAALDRASAQAADDAAASAARRSRRGDDGDDDHAGAWAELADLTRALLDDDPHRAAAAADRSALEPGVKLGLLCGAHALAGAAIPAPLVAAITAAVDALPGDEPPPAWVRELEAHAPPALAARLGALAGPAAAPAPQGDARRAAGGDAALAAWARAALAAARAGGLLELAAGRLDDAVAAVAEAVAAAATDDAALEAVAALLLEADFVDEVYAGDDELVAFLRRVRP